MPVLRGRHFFHVIVENPKGFSEGSPAAQSPRKSSDELNLRGENKMSKMNHARHSHRGRPTEMAFSPKSRWAKHQPAKAATPGRSLSHEEIAKHAAAMGISISLRAA